MKGVSPICPLFLVCALEMSLYPMSPILVEDRFQIGAQYLPSWGQCQLHPFYKIARRSELTLTQKSLWWASLVAQWLRVCLLMQGTWVRALVWEDPTCHGAARPVSHNC